jgi:hypothetical protein
LTRCTDVISSECHGRLDQHLLYSQSAGSVAWSTLLASLAEHHLVRPPFRAGTPFRDGTNRSDIVWPENWIVPETPASSASGLVLRDFRNLHDAVGYVAGAAEATITVDAPQSSFHTFPDTRSLSAALALYRFRDGIPFRIGIPQDLSDVVDEFPELANQPTEPRWQGTVKELLWIHGKCVPVPEEFCGSPIHRMLTTFWPNHLLLADEFL